MSQEQRSKNYKESLLPLGVIAVLIGGYFIYSHYTNLAHCRDVVRFVPATQSVSADCVGFGCGAKQGVGAHYVYSLMKFETEKQAIDYCINQQ